MIDITVKTLDGQNRNFSVPENVSITHNPFSQGLSCLGPML